MRRFQANRAQLDDTIRGLNATQADLNLTTAQRNLQLNSLVTSATGQLDTLVAEQIEGVLQQVFLSQDNVFKPGEQISLEAVQQIQQNFTLTRANLDSQIDSLFEGTGVSLEQKIAIQKAYRDRLDRIQNEIIGDENVLSVIGKVADTNVDLIANAVLYNQPALAAISRFGSSLNADQLSGLMRALGSGNSGNQIVDIVDTYKRGTGDNDALNFSNLDSVTKQTQYPVLAENVRTFFDTQVDLVGQEHIKQRADNILEVLSKEEVFVNGSQGQDLLTTLFSGQTGENLLSYLVSKGDRSTANRYATMAVNTLGPVSLRYTQDLAARSSFVPDPNVPTIEFNKKTGKVTVNAQETFVADNPLASLGLNRIPSPGAQLLGSELLGTEQVKRKSGDIKQFERELNSIVKILFEVEGPERTEEVLQSLNLLNTPEE